MGNLLNGLLTASTHFVPRVSHWSEGLTLIFMRGGGEKGVVTDCASLDNFN